MFKELFTEANKITGKDFERMMSLLTDKNDEKGKGVAAKIKDKNKAIYRYVAGAILDLQLVTGDFTYNRTKYSRPVDYFYERSIELGATEEDFKKAFNEASSIASKYIEKYKDLKSKNLSSWVTGAFYKFLLKLGYDFKEIKRGNAMTSKGRYAMSTSGRKWTIGYEIEIISPNGTKASLKFDAITDEGIDNETVYYVLHDLTNLNDGRSAPHYGDSMGIRKWNKFIEKNLKEIDV